MIWLDPRVGSGELLPYFAPYDVPVEVMSLEYGDACFYGNGASGPELIGVERKVLTDLVSSIRSGRLSGHQLPGLAGSYHTILLVVEGLWQAGACGEIETCWQDEEGRKQGKWYALRSGARAVMYREIDHYLATLEHKCGVVVKYTANKQQTVAWLVSRYKWWNDKEWDEHRSHEAIYAPVEQQQRGRFMMRARAGPVEMVAAQLPGVDRKAYEFGKHFRSVYDMVTASEKELYEVEGIGKKGASRIWGWLRGKENGRV